jgi:hypothetical protein
MTRMPTKNPSRPSTFRRTAVLRKNLWLPKTPSDLKTQGFRSFVR